MMRIYTGSDTDLILKPFMVKLSEITYVKLNFNTDDKYSVVKESTKSGVTIDAEAGTITAHLTSDETTYFSEGVLNVQMSYRITDEAYPDGTYDGIITIPQQYYVAKSSDTTGASIDDVYESGYTAGEENAYANSVRSLNGQKGELNIKTVNGNDLLGEGNIEIKAGVTSVNGQTGDVTVDVPTVPTKVSELQNDADYQNGEQVKTAIADALTGVSAGIEWMIVNDENATAIYDEVSSHWENGNYTGKKMFKYIKDGKTLFATNVQYITDHSVSFMFLNGDNYDVTNGYAKLLNAICWKGGHFNDSETKTQTKCYIFKNKDIRSAEDADGYNQEIFGYFREIYADYAEYSKKTAALFYVGQWDEANKKFNPPYYLIENVNEYKATDADFGADFSFRASIIANGEQNEFIVQNVILNSFGGVYLANDMIDTATLNQAKEYTDEAIKNIPTGNAVTTHLFHAVDVRSEADKDEHNIEVFKLFEKAVQEGGDFQNFYVASGSRDSVEMPYWSIISVISQGNEFDADKSYRVLLHGYNGDAIMYSEYCLTSLGGVISISQPSAVVDKVPNCLLWMSNHRDEGSDFENVQLNLHGCQSYMLFPFSGTDYEINYSIIFNQGYGDSSRGVQVPLNVWNDGTDAYFSFDIGEKRYIYRRPHSDDAYDFSIFRYVKTLEIGAGGGSTGQQLIVIDKGTINSEENLQLRKDIYEWAETWGANKVKDTSKEYVLKIDDSMNATPVSVNFGDDGHIRFVSFQGSIDRYNVMDIPYRIVCIFNNSDDYTFGFITMPKEIDETYTFVGKITDGGLNITESNSPVLAHPLYYYHNVDTSKSKGILKIGERHFMAKERGEIDVQGGISFKFDVDDTEWTVSYKGDDNPTATGKKLWQVDNKVTSTSVSNIVVLSQTEYDALSSKDANTMYCIKG